MTTLDVALLLPWLGRFLWALARVGGLFLLAPVFSSSAMLPRVRLSLALMLAAILAPLAPATVEVVGIAGVVTLAGQVVIGATVGFVLKLVFGAVQFGGDLVGQSMSLSFAQDVDPQAGGSTGVLGQFYLTLASLIFLAMDGHLQLIALLAGSFHGASSASMIDAGGLHAVLAFGTQLFGGAVRVALPAMTSLLVVNIGFAAISRAAPAMNLFAVGFPITVTLGFVALWLSLRSLPGAFEALQADAWELMRQLLGS
ncbi:flagellar biosynthetic protein FliR [Rhodanobacter sp. DHB23]|uniref:flagellar biosynthetic protein FliR n=1 Tax=Rhodanobacter sp. DHB23 TaxID=2775923 RepID=UPI00177D93E0|nr:flagellar biosynthetic protein FliR [Rhodanobacter sp. DHB23]